MLTDSEVPPQSLTSPGDGDSGDVHHIQKLLHRHKDELVCQLEALLSRQLSQIQQLWPPSFASESPKPPQNADGAETDIIHNNAG